MYDVEGKSFEKYYKAYDYAIFLSNTERRKVEIKKQGAAKGVLVGSDEEQDLPEYFQDQ